MPVLSIVVVQPVRWDGAPRPVRFIPRTRFYKGREVFPGSPGTVSPQGTQILSYYTAILLESGKNCPDDKGTGLWPSPVWRRAPEVFAFFVLADDEQWVS